MTEKRSKVIFISSPFSGDREANIKFARRACLYAICLGYTPIAPHLIYPDIIPDEDPAWRQVGLQMCCDILELCDELWVCGPCATAGMRAEIERAKEMGLWLRQVTCEEVERGLDTMESVAMETRLKLIQP
ncbi:DUF4406 domain-containing protein [Ruminococcaceae bacterium OttesenSCG-928-I18]|nr:DUF4406 domain-containing protein [Ruminococcaceae bacterium OttesenSCG-928-I18]